MWSSGSMWSLPLGSSWTSTVNFFSSWHWKTSKNLWYLENPKDGGAWWAAVSGVAQSRTWLKRLSSSSKRVLVDASEFSVYNIISSGSIILLIYFFKKKFTWLHCVLVMAQGIFNCGMRTLSCNVWTLSYGIVGSSSLTKDQTWAPCIGSVKS